MPEEPILAFDTETHLIGEGKIAPPIVCCSVYYGGDTLLAAKADPGDALESMVEAVINGRSGHHLRRDNRRTQLGL